MKAYPISTTRDYYRGKDARKREKASEFNRVATKVESYINNDLRDKPTDEIYQYLSYAIARELREDSDLVHRAVSSIDGGHNGATIFKGDYEKAISKLR